MRRFARGCRGDCAGRQRRVSQLNPQRVRRHDRPHAIRPLDDNGGFGLDKLIKAYRGEFRRARQSIGVDVMEADSPGILVYERERWTGHRVGIAQAVANRNALCQKGLAGAQRSNQTDGKLPGERAPDRLAQREGLLGGCCFPSRGMIVDRQCR